MRSRREQVQAYRFLTRRIGSALLSGEPETTELPLRRFAYALFGGLVVGAVLVAGFGIYGLLVPGGRRPVEGAVIIERESGAKFLYLRGLLHPVLNLASARLILGQAAPAVRTMSQKSLRDVPRGRPVGIPGAPDTLPARSALIGLPWSVCSAPQSPTSVALATHVFAGFAPPGGTVPGPDRGVLVSTGDGQSYLLWQDHRLRVPGNAIVAALGWAGVPPVAVGETFLNAVPPGPDLAPVAVPGAGTVAQRPVAGRTARVGQLFQAAGQHYVMLGSGLAPIGEVGARLLAGAGQAVTGITPQDAGQALTTEAAEPPGYPTRIPDVRGVGTVAMICAGYRGSTAAEAPVSVETFERVDAPTSLVAGQAPQAGADGVLTAERVTMPGGRAAVVRTLAPPGANAPGNVYLVTDQGLKHPLAGDVDQVQTSLGYGGVRPVAIPGAILALIPTGAALDPQAAALLVPAEIRSDRS